MKKIAIVNYGVGNLQSVYNAFSAVGGTAKIIDSPKDIKAFDMIVLPGVGAFGDGMKNLTTMGWKEALEKEVQVKKKPFIGFCLGMQLLATTGYEHGVFQGLGWVAGTVDKMVSNDSDVRIPHIGWNNVRFIKKNGIYNNIGDEQSFYFVHSYILNPTDKNVISGICSHGADFVASIEIDNISATQFHPEKSHKAGLTVIKNFIEKYS